MRCMFGPVQWWLIDVMGTDGPLCQIVVNNPSEHAAERIIDDLLGSDPNGKRYRMIWHHGHGVYQGNLNKTEQVHDGLCC